MTATNKKPTKTPEPGQADLSVRSCEPKRKFHRKAAPKQPEQVAFVREVGERLKQARLLNQMSLGEAASRMGYADQANLSKLETAKHVTTIPLLALADAAKLYEVPADYLLCLTDELSHQPRVQLSREINSWLANMVERRHKTEYEMLCLLHEEVSAIFTAFKEISVLVQGLDEALARFKELNPRFENMRGGATVQLRTTELMGTTARVQSSLNKFRHQMQAARMSPTPAAQAALFND